MYGTVATMKIKPGSEAQLKELNDRWWRERGSKVKGALSSTIFRSDRDANELMLIAVFESKESYEANAGDPEQDKWYREMAQHFAGEPVWNDGEVLFHHSEQA